MTFHRFKDWMLMGLMTAGVYIMWDMKSSVDKLNTSVATIIEKSIWHERQINQHDERIRSLETKGR